MLTSNTRMHRVGHAVSASDLRWISGYLSTKGPRSPALAWHQDWWCWDHPVSFRECAAQVAVLCYITPTTSTSGALRVLPGSHLRQTALHQHLPEPHAADAGALPATHPAAIDSAGQITVTVEAGDAIVIDYRLLHGTHANDAAERRDCILLSFTPDWCALPADVKAHLIQHPALPAITEADRSLACGYTGLLPDYDGPHRDLPINRLPPPAFNIIARS
jgi:ectoine hydroxylase-related dioxygenase (phytanoyl-CoA dioxygenase family)